MHHTLFAEYSSHHTAWESLQVQRQKQFHDHIHQKGTRLEQTISMCTTICWTRTEHSLLGDILGCMGSPLMTDRARDLTPCLPRQCMLHTDRTCTACNGQLSHQLICHLIVGSALLRFHLLAHLHAEVAQPLAPCPAANSQASWALIATAAASLAPECGTG